MEDDTAAVTDDKLDDLVMLAWGLIANVSEGDWTQQTQEWQKAAVHWRDKHLHPFLSEGLTGAIEVREEE